MSNHPPFLLALLNNMIISPTDEGVVPGIVIAIVDLIVEIVIVDVIIDLGQGPGTAILRAEKQGNSVASASSPPLPPLPPPCVPLSSPLHLYRLRLNHPHRQFPPPSQNPTIPTTHTHLVISLPLALLPLLLHSVYMLPFASSLAL